MITLTTEQKQRLGILNAGHGNRSGLYSGGPNKCKITIKQLKYIKKAQLEGIDRPELMKRTGLSHYIVTRAMNGKYNHLLRYETD